MLRACLCPGHRQHIESSQGQTHLLLPRLHPQDFQPLSVSTGAWRGPMTASSLGKRRPISKYIMITTVILAKAITHLELVCGETLYIFNSNKNPHSYGVDIFLPPLPRERNGFREVKLPAWIFLPGPTCLHSLCSEPQETLSSPHR